MKGSSITWVWVGLGLGLGACRGPVAPPASPSQVAEPRPSPTEVRTPIVVHRPLEASPPAPIACEGPRGHQRVLTLDWPVSERMALVDALPTGQVVVRYEGCTLQWLPACRVPAITYDYVAMPSLEYGLAIGPEPALRIANLPRLAATEAAGSKRAEVSATIVTSGRYEAAPIDLRRAPIEGRCEGATHVISTVDVGRVLESTLGHRPRDYDCYLSAPDSTEPPPLCREPWSVHLAALDPLVASGSPCPAPLHWNGLQCGHGPGTEISATCTIAPPDAPACLHHWRNSPLGRPDAQWKLFPRRLDDAMVEVAMGRIQDALDDCGARWDAPPDTHVRVLLHVDGPSGRVIEAQAIGRQAQTPLGACVVQAAADARFETTLVRRQKVSPTLRTR